MDLTVVSGEEPESSLLDDTESDWAGLQDAFSCNCFSRVRALSSMTYARMLAAASSSCQTVTWAQASALENLCSHCR